MNIVDYLQIPIFQRALWACVLAGSGLALAGTVVVHFKLTTIRFALMHLALLGGALGMLIGMEPLWGAMLAIVIGSLLFGPLSSWVRIDTAVSGAFMMTGSLALALALFYVAEVPAMAVFSLFTGSILTLTTTDMWLLTAICILIFIVFVGAYREIQLIFFDPEAAACVGIPVKRIQHVLLFLTGVSIGLALKLVGALLIDALVLLPAMAASRLAGSFRQLLLFTVGLGVLIAVGGFLCSLTLDLPAGATITMFGVLVLAISIGIGKKS